MTSQNSAEEAGAVNVNQEKAEEEPIEISANHSNNQTSDTANGNDESDDLSNSETSKPPSNPESKPCKEPTVETYTDHTGTDLMQFLTETLLNNPKDRIHLLKIEKQLTDLVKDSKRNQHKFGPMSSYHRMLVHRVAAFFGMDHNVTNVDNSVIVSKTRTTRLPDFKFSDQVKNAPEPESNEPVRAIIKRDSVSLDKLSEKGYLKDKSPDGRGNTLPLVDSRRSKSLEEREEEYEKARARIFNQDSTSSTENPSDACTNTSTTDDSVATTSSGIVVSTSATNSSPSCSHEDLKPGSNWPSTDSRLWSSTESEGSNRPRYLRLQRQKRLPDSFDSDSARTSFTSSSMSSASGMFLTPDSCLTEQQLGDSSTNNRLTFTKASSFGGISVLSRDNQSGPTSEPRLTKTASLNNPSFSDSLPRSSNHESLTVFPQSNGSQQLHLWPKKQIKSNGNYFQHGNNQGIGGSHVGQDQGSRSQVKVSHQTGKKHGDDLKSSSESPFETTRNGVLFDQSGPFKGNGNRDGNYGRSVSEGCSNKPWVPNNQPLQSQQSLTKGQSKHESHLVGNNIPRNQISSSERPKNFNPKDPIKTQVGPQIIINPVGGACMSQLITNKSPVTPDLSSAQPYYLTYQTAPSVIVDPPNMSHEDVMSKSQLAGKASKHLANQLAGLSIGNQPRNRNTPDHYSSQNSGRNGYSSHNAGHYSAIPSGGDITGMVSNDYRTTGYALTPIPANLHAQKSVLPVNAVSSSASIPLCYIHSSLPAPPPQPPLSHHHNRFGAPSNPNAGYIGINASQGYSADRYMTNVGAANSHSQQMGRPPDTYSSNVPDLEMLGQSSQQKSNLIILGSQLPVNTSNYGSYQPIPMQQPPLRPVPQVQSLVPSFQNQPQTNRIPNVPFNPNAVNGVPVSVSSSSGSASVRQGSVVTGLQAPIGCNNGMMNHSQTFPYAINHVPLPPAHTNSAQLAPTNFSYAPSMQVPPTIPMYVNTNGGTFAPNQLTGARPMPPPHQAQIIPSPYSPQTPVYRPVPLFFVFNFQNKRSN